jgi:hypothetical protein
MFRAIILPIFRNTQSSASEDGQNNCPKLVELTGIINKPLFLHLVGCLYYLYQWCTVKQISDNKIYLLIKYIKSVLRRVAKACPNIEDARCLKVKLVRAGFTHFCGYNINKKYLYSNPFCAYVHLYLQEEVTSLFTGANLSDFFLDIWKKKKKMTGRVTFLILRRNERDMTINIQG